MHAFKKLVFGPLIVLFLMTEFLRSAATDRPASEGCGSTGRETVHADLPDAADGASISMQKNKL